MARPGGLASPGDSGPVGKWTPPGRGRYQSVTFSEDSLALLPTEFVLLGGPGGHPFCDRVRIVDMDPRNIHPAAPELVPPEGREQGLDGLLALVARGDEAAFEAVYARLAGAAYGLIRKVVRDPAQSEEVAQDVLLEVWRTASRFDPAKGSAAAWVMTIAHRRAIDRVRSVTATAARDQMAAEPLPASDEVAEAVEARLDRERVWHCLDGLTELQRESITLAYYGGYSYRQVAALLGATLSSIKTRIRDGLIRMRDCLGVSG